MEKFISQSEKDYCTCCDEHIQKGENFYIDGEECFCLDCFNNIDFE